MEDVHVPELGREPIGEPTGSIGRVVVDDEHPAALGEHLAEAAQHGLEVVPLVVCGQADDGSHGVRIIATWRQRCRAMPT